MRRVTLWVLVGLAACGPKVDPRSPFDEDDPRARAATSTTPATDPTVAEASVAPTPVVASPPPVVPAPPGTGVREGVLDRAVLKTVLDAGPGKLLAGFEVAAQEDGGRFVGWRLVRFLPSGRSLTVLDLAPGDVLLTVNGRPLVKPRDLQTLWAELYLANEIVAELRRGDRGVTIRFAIRPALGQARAGGDAVLGGGGR